MTGRAEMRSVGAGYAGLPDSPIIEIELGRDCDELRDDVRTSHVVHTGPADAGFGYRFGPSPYRSQRFEHERLPASRDATRWIRPISPMAIPISASPSSIASPARLLFGEEG